MLDPTAAAGPTAAESARHLQPQEYHRILRTWNYRPWKPAIGLVVLGGSYLLFAGVITVAFLFFEVAATGEEPSNEFLETVTPRSLVMINLVLAAAIPASMLALLVAHGLRPGWLGSVRPGLRWRLFLPFGGMALVATAAVTLLSAFLPVDESLADTVTPVALSEWLAFAAVVALTTPLQAAGEEYAFRGYLNQALGAWVKSPWFAIVVTSALFALAHGGQNPALFADRFTFGMVAGWLVWRTGGLEAAIALHVVNNTVSFLVAAAFDQVSDSLAVSDIPWAYALLDVAGMLVLAYLMAAYARRRALQPRTKVITA